MDLSIAAALFFASRGEGIYRSKSFTTSARVLLSGLGADELFAGYQRHRLAFQRKGWAGLSEQLQMDMDRLPERNLGRDDRVISSTGREARFPFLTPLVLELACSLPVHYKAFYGQIDTPGNASIRQNTSEEAGENVHSHLRAEDEAAAAAQGTATRTEDSQAQDKRLLRDAARSLGLRYTAERPKRAIQFGARSAKLDSTPKAGTNGSSRYGQGERKVL